MANKKFSEFVLKTNTSGVSHIVGYSGAENVQITPANFVTSGGTGIFLPLIGGTITGALTVNDILTAGLGLAVTGGTVGSSKLVLASTNKVHLSGGSAGLILQNSGGTKSLTIDDTLSTFVGLVSGITPVDAANFVTKAYLDGGGGAGNGFLPLAGGTMLGNTIHNDNVKSIYGTSGDGLEIFHNATDSIIADTGSGNLFIRASSSLRLQGTNQSNFLIASVGSSVNLYFDNANKFATTNTGVEVIGNIDGTGNLSLKSDTSYFRLKRADNTDLGYITDSATWGDSGADFSIGASSSNLKFYTNNSTSVRLTIDATGNASFTNNLGVGVNPVLKLDVLGTASTPTPFGSPAVNGVVRIESGSTNPMLDIGSNSAAPYEMWLQAHVPSNLSGTPISLQPLGGNVGIGVANPQQKLEVYGNIRAFEAGATVGAYVDIVSGATWRFKSNPTTGTNPYGLDIIKGSAGTDVKLSITQDGNATFGGNIGLSTNTTTPTDGNAYIYKSSAGAVVSGFQTLLETGSAGSRVTALTIDSSQNSSFNGTVTIADGTRGELILSKAETGVSRVSFVSAGAEKSYLELDAIEDMVYYAGSGIKQLFYSNGITTLKLDSTDATFSGDVIIGTSGKGILLGGTGAANRLDDYEEGTFTPVLKFGGAEVGINYTAQNGVYTKVGRLVSFSIEIRLGSKGSSTGICTISNLPFTSDSTLGNYGAASVSFSTNFALANNTCFTIDNGSTTIRPRFNSSGSNANYTNSEWSDNSTLIIRGSYAAV